MVIDNKMPTEVGFIRLAVGTLHDVIDSKMPTKVGKKML